MIWDKMTPEFPRAPSKAPRAKCAATASTLDEGFSVASRMAARSVRTMLVPVSPSGTG